MTELFNGAGESAARRVARLIETSSVRIGESAIWPVARGFTREDPDAAIQWAMGLTDPETSRLATGAVVSIWVDIDSEAAQRWVLRQPRGARRDGVLDTLMLDGVRQQLDRRALVAAFESEAAAQKSIVGYIQRVGRSYRPGDPSTDVDLLMTLLRDPAERRRAEDVIAGR
jgi:hypothetical protein